MLKIIFAIILIIFIGISANQTYAQEIGLATFQESAQVIIDNKILQETISPGLTTDKFVKSIFSGDWKRGTLRTAFTKNKPNNVKDTVFT